MNLAPTTLAAQLRQLKPVQLRLLAELSETGALGLAAARVGIAQPAASRLLSEMEGSLGLSLHERQGRGLRLTEVGEALARRAARIQVELADAARDLTEAATGRAGVIRVGAVTGPALNLVLPVLRELQEEHPDIRAEVTVETSVTLCEQLRSGRLDFALARPGQSSGEFDSRRITDEPVSLVVRRDHPLLSLPGIEASDLMRYDWVMGDNTTLLTQSVLGRLAQLGLPMPRRRISTSSFLFTLAVISQTDAIAPLARPVVERLVGRLAFPFVPLPVELAFAVPPFSLVTRSGAQLTPSAELLVRRILKYVEQGREGAVDGPSFGGS